MSQEDRSKFRKVGETDWKILGERTIEDWLDLYEQTHDINFDRKAEAGISK